MIFQVVLLDHSIALLSCSSTARECLPLNGSTSCAFAAVALQPDCNACILCEGFAKAEILRATVGPRLFFNLGLPADGHSCLMLP